MRLLLLATLLLLLSSCSRKVFFCNQVRVDYQLTESQLKQTLFYTSKRIRLYAAEVPPGEKRATIIVPKRTPVIVDRVGPDRLGVRFEAGSDRLLFFGAKDPYSPYVVLAKEWTEGHGLVEYEGKKFFVAPGGGKASLIMDLNQFKNDGTQQRRRVRGLIH